MKNLIVQVDIPKNLSQRGMFSRDEKLYTKSKNDFRKYASNCGCEYELISEPPDMVSNPHPAWARMKPVLDSTYDEYDFILYVDCDVLVQNGKPNIFALALDEQYIYGVPVLSNHATVEKARRDHIIDQCREHRIPPQSYFNSGVIIMGKGFRKTARELWPEYKSFWENKPTLKCNDQTFLNTLGQRMGRVGFLGSEWNFLRRGNNGNFRNANFVHLLDKNLRSYRNPLYDVFQLVKKCFK